MLARLRLIPAVQEAYCQKPWFWNWLANYEAYLAVKPAV
jgi:hypothetical protein